MASLTKYVVKVQLWALVLSSLFCGHCSGKTGLTFNLSALNVQKKEVKKTEFNRKEEG